MSWRTIVLGMTMVSSCGGPPGDVGVSEVVFTVESDPGVRLAGAQIFADGKMMGATGSNGLVRARIRSQPDQPTRIVHDCPDGHEASSEPKVLWLRKFKAIGGFASAPIEITLRCRPMERLAVFIVRARNGQDLSVLLDGEIVTRTNAFGVAHFSSRGAPGTEYSIRLDTSEHPRLLPKSPSYQFTSQDADEIFVVNQSFEVVKAPARRGPRRARIIKIE